MQAGAGGQDNLESARAGSVDRVMVTRGIAMSAIHKRARLKANHLTDQLQTQHMPDSLPGHPSLEMKLKPGLQESKIRQCSVELSPGG